MNYWQTSRRALATENIPEDPYFKQAADFCGSWLAGAEKFTIHTSGSTGEPKPILISRAQMSASARMTAEALDLPRSNGRALVCLNVAYIAGMMMLVRGMVLDWNLTIVAPGGNPLAELPDEAQFDFVAMVPLQLQSILSNPATQIQVGRCGKILLGGAAVSLDLERKVRELDVPVYLSYGMTETVSHVALRRLNGDAPESDFRTVGDIAFGTDDRGCLWVSGAVTNFVKIQTNDLITITSDRTFTWLGRADSVINSGGVKIQLAKIDRAVEAALHDLGISGNYFSWHEPDAILGQKLVLFIEASDPEIDRQALFTELAARLTRYEIPKAVYFVKNFMRTPTDKLDRQATATAYFENQK